MAVLNPIISLFLDGDIALQLHHKGFAGSTPTLKIQMHDISNSATLTIPGYQSSTKSLSLPQALQGGLFDLFDIESNQKISVVSNDQQPGELVVEAGARNQWFNLAVDTCDDFWTQLLSPGHKYEIRWTDGDTAPQARCIEDHKNSSEQLSVRLLPRPIKLHVFDDTTAPPRISLSLSPTDKICHLSGEPRFGFALKVTSHAEKVITVCLHKTPLKELHSLDEIAKVEDEDDEVEWPYGIGCFEGREPFPCDDMFEELHPNVPFERMFWLEKYDDETSNGGELEELHAGVKYKGQVSKTLLQTFTNWKWGTKEELLRGEEKEKEERWKGSKGQLIVEVSEPFTFETAA